jgi:hypothetical protein
VAPPPHRGGDFDSGSGWRNRPFAFEDSPESKSDSLERIGRPVVPALPPEGENESTGRKTAQALMFGCLTYFGSGSVRPTGTDTMARPIFF